MFIKSCFYNPAGQAPTVRYLNFDAHFDMLESRYFPVNLPILLTISLRKFRGTQLEQSITGIAPKEEIKEVYPGRQIKIEPSDETPPKKKKLGRPVPNKHPIQKLLLSRNDNFTKIMGGHIRTNKADIPKDSSGNTVCLWFHCDGICHDECFFKVTHVPLVNTVVDQVEKFKISAITARARINAANL